jgi:hypothetical protein
MARLHFDGLGLHPLGHEALEVWIDRSVFCRNRIVARVRSQGRVEGLAGNICVNRNIIGAVVGVQPFGGHGLSGTGPKAGGPLYLKRLLSAAPPLWSDLGQSSPPSFVVYKGVFAERLDGNCVVNSPNTVSIGGRGPWAARKKQQRE